LWLRWNCSIDLVSASKMPVGLMAVAEIAERALTASTWRDGCASERDGAAPARALRWLRVARRRSTA
jgi:hypothetical protein